MPTVVSISSETVALPLFWLKEQYCSWRCLSSVFYSYIATIKPILTDSIWQQRQSTKSKPSCQEAVPTATHFYRTHAHEQAQSIQVNIKSHTAPSPLPTPPVFCQPPHILGKPTSSLPTASSPDYDRAQLKSPKAGPIPQKAWASRCILHNNKCLLVILSTYDDLLYDNCSLIQQCIFQLLPCLPSFNSNDLLFPKSHRHISVPWLPGPSSCEACFSFSSCVSTHHPRPINKHGCPFISYLVRKGSKMSELNTAIFKLLRSFGEEKATS